MTFRGSIVLELFVGMLVLALAGGSALAQTADQTVGAEGQAIERSLELANLLFSGEYEAVTDVFASDLSAALDADALAGVMDTLPLQFGALMGVDQPYVAGTVPYITVRIPLAFEAATIDLLLALDDEERLVTLAFVPHVPEPDATGSLPPYVDSQTFDEVDLTFGTTQFPLEGTLTLPRSDGPFPAVVLVHGSGPHDRDETIGANKPFRDLARGLASRGIAVFRYDKRTAVHLDLATDMTLTVEEEVIVDAVEAIRLITDRPDISEVYVLGHSLGGMLAPYIGQAAPEVDGLILLAANARPLSTLVIEQMDYLSAFASSPEETMQLEALKDEMQQFIDGQLDDAAAVMNVPMAYWKDIESRDQVQAASSLDQPMLVLQGDRDYQVTTVDFELWQDGLSTKSNVEYRLYPGLNHLFIAGEGPSLPQEYAVAGFVAEEVVDDIATWIGAQ